MKSHIVLSLYLIVLFHMPLSAQTPQQDLAQAAKEHLVRMSDTKTAGDCIEASIHLRWLLGQTPKYHKNLYVQGAQIYDCLVAGTNDSNQKKIYKDSALLIYDLRIAYFGEKAKVMNYKANAGYKYYIKYPEKYDQLWQWFGTALELNGVATFNSNLLGFADLMVRYNQYRRPLPFNTVMPIYDQISNIIELKLKTGKDIDKVRNIQAKVDGIMEGFFKENENLSCSDLAASFGSRFDQNPEGINFAKTFFRLLRAADCKDDPYYIKTAEAMFGPEPTYALAVLIASHLASQKDFIKAEQYYIAALKLTEDNTQIADIYTSLGDLKKVTGAFEHARDYYKKTIAADPSSKEKAYTKIGDLYYYSFDQCKQGQSKVQDRAVYFAAFEMYQKAGNQPRVELAKAQFPLGSEIHMDTNTNGLGKKIMVGCWINVEATIRKRDGTNN